MQLAKPDPKSVKGAQMVNESVVGRSRKTRKGLFIGLLLLVVLIGLWWGVPTYRKAKADLMVKELCAKEGGNKIYEIVRLPPDRFGQQGNVVFFGNKNLPPLKEKATPHDEFYFTYEKTWIVLDAGFNSLAIWRSHHKLYRAIDDKLLAESVAYSRRGGDPMGPWHPSSFGCPLDADIVYLQKKTFLKQ
jgi:hypothetical protein